MIKTAKEAKNRVEFWKELIRKEQHRFDNCEPNRKVMHWQHLEGLKSRLHKAKAMYAEFIGK